MTKPGHITQSDLLNLPGRESGGKRSLRAVGEGVVQGRGRGEKRSANSAIVASQKPNKYGARKTERHGRDYKADFLRDVSLLNLPAPEVEYLFALPRKWRFDFAWPQHQIAVEYQGIFGKRNASHASVAQLMRDYRKFTEAGLRGWIVILIDAASASNGDALNWLARAFERVANDKSIN